MAPEQRRGERCDARADQYAFCVALREALGERRPAWLANAIERGLAPRPADRFASMDALLAALERHSRRRARPLAVLAVVAAAAAAAASVPRDGETRTRVVDRPVIQRVVAPAPAPAPAGERASAPASPAALHEPTRAPRDAQIVVRDVPVAARVAPLWLARATVDESGASMIVSPRASRASDRPALPAIESYGGMTLAPDCDDGSERRCTLAEPLCARPAIVAVQDGCWRCVDATTCEPIAELAAVGTAAGHSHGAPQGSNAGSNTGADHGSDNGPGPGSGGGSGGGGGGSGFGPDGNPL